MSALPQAANARYKSAIGSQPHGTACMAALGFAPIFEASEQVTVATPQWHMLADLWVAQRVGSICRLTNLNTSTFCHVGLWRQNRQENDSNPFEILKVEKSSAWVVLQVLIMETPSDELPRVKLLLEAAMGPARSAAAGRPAPSAHAGAAAAARAAASAAFPTQPPAAPAARTSGSAAADVGGSASAAPAAGNTSGGIPRGTLQLLC